MLLGWQSSSCRGGSHLLQGWLLHDRLRGRRQRLDLLQGLHRRGRVRHGSLSGCLRRHSYRGRVLALKCRISQGSHRCKPLFKLKLMVDHACIELGRLLLIDHLPGRVKQCLHHALVLLNLFPCQPSNVLKFQALTALLGSRQQ